jgi:CheY-like chemotaxis protein
MFPSRPDVLLVEDDAAIREALSEVLADEGFAVQTAVHGQAALEALAAGARPKIILLDLMMPVMDGWQFMQHLRRRHDWAQIPVIVVSAAKEPMPTGARGCLSKPVDLGVLFDAMGPWCSQAGAADMPLPAPKAPPSPALHA